MHSLSPDYLAKLRFDTQQLATLRALGEYRGKQQLYVAQSPEVLSDLRQVAVVESTESSNRLEGVVVAAHRLKSLVLKNAAPQSRLTMCFCLSPSHVSVHLPSVLILRYSHKAEPRPSRGPLPPASPLRQRPACGQHRSGKTTNNYTTTRLMAGQRLGYAAQQMGHTVDMFVHTYTRWINDGHSALEDQKLEQFLALETPEVAVIGGVS